jgi:transposase, IS5 family
VWADTAYRSQKNAAFLPRNGFTSQIHRKKPAGHPMPTPIRRANARKSAVRSRIEHVFAEQKDRMGLFIIGIARARLKIGLANLVYNMKRFIWLERTAAAT